MCRVTVNCHCHRTSGNGWIVLVALVALAFIVAPVIVAALQAAVDLLTAIVIGMVVAAGIVVVGWVVKNIAVAVYEERSLRRHNERMAERYPLVRAHLEKVARTRPQAHAIPAPAPQPRPITAPVRIYPTPRSELAAARNPEVV